MTAEAARPDAAVTASEAYAAALPLMGRFGRRMADTPTPATAIRGQLLADTDWLAARVRDTGARWSCTDARTNGTLWWYSASAILASAAPAMVLATGFAPDPAPEQLTCSLTDHGYLHAVRRDRLLTAAEYAEAIAPALAQIIAPLARVSGASERALWAVASDSIANRALNAGRESGRITEAGTLAAQWTRPPLLPPRFADVAADEGPRSVDRNEEPAAGATRVLRRSSCCLIYRTPNNTKCVSCPRHHPDERARILRSWAGDRP